MPEPAEIIYIPEHGKTEDDVPHILTTRLRIGNKKNKFIF
jgi:hypothetical protein